LSPLCLTNFFDRSTYPHFFRTFHLATGADTLTKEPLNWCCPSRWL
jgi:hypothetical protein